MAIEQEVEDTKELEKAQAEDRAQKKTTKNKSNKFEHLLAGEAKAVNETNKQYGIVPSVLKKGEKSLSFSGCPFCKIILSQFQISVQSKRLWLIFSRKRN